MKKGSTPAAVECKPHGLLGFWNWGVWGFGVLEISPKTRGNVGTFANCFVFDVMAITKALVNCDFGQRFEST